MEAHLGRKEGTASRNGERNNSCLFALYLWEMLSKVVNNKCEFRALSIFIHIQADLDLIRASCYNMDY